MQELDELSFHFFKLFSQYEYALKRMKFYKIKNKNRVEADWDAFSNNIGALIFNHKDDQVREAIDYLFEYPPKYQVIKNDDLDWDNVTNTDRSPQTLFSHIRRCRNNLFHGGKFNGQWLEPDRSHDLLSKSLIILKSLIDLDERLAEVIYGNAI